MKSAALKFLMNSRIITRSNAFANKKSWAFLVQMGSIFVCSFLPHLKGLILKKIGSNIPQTEMFTYKNENNFPINPNILTKYVYVYSEDLMKNWVATPKGFLPHCVTTKKKRSIRHRMTTTLMCLQRTKFKLIIFWDIRLKMRPKKSFCPVT